MTKSTAQPQQQSQSLLVKLGFLGAGHVVEEPASENPAVEESSGEAGKRGAARRNATCGIAGVAAASRGRYGSNWNGSGSRKKPDVDSNAHEPHHQIESPMTLSMQCLLQ